METCWVWGGTAVTEVALDVRRGIRDRLRVEYFDATYRAWSGPDWAGEQGWITDFAAHLATRPVLDPWSNANASYRDRPDGPAIAFEALEIEFADPVRCQDNVLDPRAYPLTG